jgi:hypothetical protein
MMGKKVPPMACCLCADRHRKSNEPLMQLRMPQSARLYCNQDFKQVAQQGALALATVLTVSKKIAILLPISFF